MKYMIRELRDSTGMTQKEFAHVYRIPLRTLQKWEQGQASPPPYVVDLLARTLPVSDAALHKVVGTSGKVFYYDRQKRIVMDTIGNAIRIHEDPASVKEENLGLYLEDLFQDFYEIQSRFDRDCRYDKEEDIIWDR